MDKNIIGFIMDGEAYMENGGIWINMTEGKIDFYLEIPYEIITGRYKNSSLIYDTE